MDQVGITLLAMSSIPPLGICDTFCFSPESRLGLLARIEATESADEPSASVSVSVEGSFLDMEDGFSPVRKRLTCSNFAPKRTTLDEDGPGSSSTPNSGGSG